MKTIVDKLDIIRQKENGHSNRQVAKMLRINRKTVAKYWNQYQKDKAELENPEADK